MFTYNNISNKTQCISFIVTNLLNIDNTTYLNINGLLLVDIQLKAAFMVLQHNNTETEITYSKTNIEVSLHTQRIPLLTELLIDKISVTL